MHGKIVNRNNLKIRILRRFIGSFPVMPWIGITIVRTFAIGIVNSESARANWILFIWQKPTHDGLSLLYVHFMIKRRSVQCLALIQRLRQVVVARDCKIDVTAPLRGGRALPLFHEMVA